MTLPAFQHSGVSYGGQPPGAKEFPLTTSGGAPIGYLLRAHIHVYKTVDNGLTLTELTRPSQWDFNQAGTVVVLAAGIAAGEAIIVRRRTPLDSLYSTFGQGTLLTADQLNDAERFSLYVNQEAYDSYGQGVVDAAAALTAAAAATTTANTAKVTADEAKVTADGIAATANTAKTTADAAKATADGIAATANQAAADATAAINTANEAKTTADGISGVANLAAAEAASAAAVATDAKTTADGVAGTANTAKATADAAKATADTAKATADAAQVTADGALPKAGGAMAGNLTVPSLNGGALAGTRNLLINANPLINQRLWTSGKLATATGVYFLDRWRIVGNGQAVTWSDSAGVRTLTLPNFGVEQIVEDVCNLGGVHTLSWVGTAVATVNGVAVVNGGQVTLTPNTNVRVKFTGGTLALPQLEPGPVATPFERRNPAIELMLCQRYYIAIDGPVCCHTTTNGAVISVPGLDNMRALPYVGLYAQAFGFYNGTGWTGGTASSAVAAVNANYYGRFISAQGLAGNGTLTTPTYGTVAGFLDAEIKLA